MKRFFSKFKKPKSPFAHQLDEESADFTVNGINAHIKRTEMRPFYDSTWIIVINNKNTGKSFQCEVVRRDDETIEGLMQELRTIHLVESEIMALNKKNTIYYD